MKSTHIVSMLTILVLFFGACRKKDKTIYIDPALKQHFNFGKGSYWIYEDSATGKWDTFTVYSSTTSIKTDPPPDQATKREDLLISTEINGTNNSTYNLFIRLRGNSVGFYFDNLRIVFGATTSELSNSGAFGSMQIGTTMIDSIVTSRFERSSCSIRKDLGAVRIHLENDTIAKTWLLVKWKTF